ncbi:hypothetical protein MtrunA17_Chr7g0260151 [Medicago truncatula]|uniref:RNase H type-1 domain-containing protein n=1 Tax=Medicago truncatula TaxID=3880 RepID=A0A396HA58_MEDTR|nr:hypothetical protein MtrunA17_Chr7g0260151 [Medicago truncatula]
MEQNRQGWNWGLIDGMFNERDKGEICKLTITMATEEDKLIWKFNNRGNYTVKSAYRYAMETLIDNEEYRVPGEWEKMWKLRFPQRVKVFLWSAQIAVHIVRTITRMIGTSLLVVKRQSKFGKLLGYGKLFLKLLLQLPTQLCTDIAMMLWCLWRRRNDKVWEGDMKEVRFSVQLAREVLLQWQAARINGSLQSQVQQSNLQHQHSQQQMVQVWQSPNEDYVKCNVDAALFGEQRCFGIGMCLRNHQGHFIKALTKWYEGTPPPQEAEALGLRDAIIWLGHLGMSKVHTELDCKLVLLVEICYNTFQTLR